MKMTALLALLPTAFLLALFIAWRRRMNQPDEDLAVLRRLEQAGPNPTQSHHPEFFLYLPTQAAAESLAQELNADGFRTEVQSSERNGMWLCLATKAMTLDESTLRDLRSRLTAMAEARGGEYDGWGTTLR